MNRFCLIVLTISACTPFVLSLKLDHKIVNGSVAAPGEFPYMVSLRSSRTGSHFCGGSLLNPNWVLTAAHCIARVQAQNVSVQYGSNRLQKDSSNVVNVAKIYRHQGYIGANNTYRDDIALLKLSQKVVFSKNATAIKLPRRNLVVPNGTPVVLAGWGLNATNGTVQTNLQKVNLQTFDYLSCSLRHQKPMHYTTICAGVPEGWKGQCSGDSGGPLITSKGIQVGIVSWSVKPCAVPPYPGVFTAVSSYIDWIKNTINDDANTMDCGIFY